jgi:two-component system, OmpR family, response regulator
MARTILILDDHQSFVEVVAFVLDEAGFQVVTFTDPLAALAHLAEQPPDLILSDVRMPDLDGVTLAQRIRALGYRMPVVLISGQTVAPVDLAGVSVVEKTMGIDDLISLIEQQFP